MLPVLLLLLPVVALALESVITGSTRHDSTTILLDTVCNFELFVLVLLFYVCTGIVATW